MNLIIQWIGGNCPVQAEGTIDGVPFYFRSRGERWSFSVHENDPVGVALGEVNGFYVEEIWGKFPEAGWMDVDTAEQIIKKCANEYHGLKN